ncbi:hypothetical protein MMC13_003993 [Lambiella insularis]|nr:hypothetical protein [Lambiella insularis]
MPRMTRAALRTNAILEDEANLAAATPLPSTPTLSRQPLGEVVGNIYGEITNHEALKEDVKHVKKAAAKDRRAKSTKKRNKKGSVEEKNASEVLEDEYQSSTSSAVEEAREELLKGDSKETYQIPMHDSRPRTPPSKAVDAVVKQLSPKSHTPRFDPVIHKTPEADQKPGAETEDSFIDTIGTRTPGLKLQPEKIEEDLSNKSTTSMLDAARDESFAEKVMERTPPKPITRIEDSVEAIDALEDAIDQISAALPVIMDERASPLKQTLDAKKKKSTRATIDQKTPHILSTKKPATVLSGSKKPTALQNPTSSSQKKVPSRKLPSNISTAASRGNSTSRSTPLKPAHPKATAHLTPRLAKPIPAATSAPASSTKPTRYPTLPPAKPSRVSSITKAPFVPHPSSKAPTRSTFSLPGDAVAQKLKAQRESRQKRDDDDASQKRAFKARPVRHSIAPVVKATATSRARMSLLAGAPTAEVKSKKEGAPTHPVPAVAPRLSSISSTTTQLNGHSAAAAKRASMAAPSAPKAKANISAARAPSLVGAARAGPSTAKGKEVFGRALAEQEAREAGRREKEEAARRARAEAAERGRVASREWAERMKRREKAVGRGGA